MALRLLVVRFWKSVFLAISNINTLKKLFHYVIVKIDNSRKKLKKKFSSGLINTFGVFEM